VPYGAFINALPPAFFLAVHLIGFLVGAFFAYRAFERMPGPLGWGFILYALAELCYMTYHLDWTVFLFAHTISEVLDLVAFILVFVGATRSLRSRPPTRNVATMPVTR
jgi:Mn2+/Fe2+ NRAMP family transporter